MVSKFFPLSSILAAVWCLGVVSVAHRVYHSNSAIREIHSQARSAVTRNPMLGNSDCQPARLETRAHCVDDDVYSVTVSMVDWILPVLDLAVGTFFSFEH